MPKKSDAFLPRIYTKTQGKARTYYIKYWPDRTDPKSPKFHKTHDGKCECGKPRPNRPCPHYQAAQEVLITFEHKYNDKPVDATIGFLVHEWYRSDHSGRKESTVELYMDSYKVFLEWCANNKITHASQLLDSHSTQPMADLKRHLTTVPFVRLKHTAKSRRILRRLDYLVRRDKITRNSPEYMEENYQELERQMKELMVKDEVLYSASTVHRIFRDLRVLFGFGMWRKLMSSNPLDESGKPRSQRIKTSLKVQEQRRNPLTKAEQQRILEKTTGDTLDMVIVYLYTGMRLDELANFHWGAHVRQARICMCPVNGWSPKWGKSRTIPIHPRVREVLERQKARHPGAEYVFNTLGHKRGPRPGQRVPYDKHPDTGPVQESFQQPTDSRRRGEWSDRTLLPSHVHNTSASGRGVTGQGSGHRWP